MVFKLVFLVCLEILLEFVSYVDILRRFLLLLHESMVKPMQIYKYNFEYPLRTRKDFIWVKIILSFHNSVSIIIYSKR